MVNSATHKLWWGAGVADTMWGPPWGGFFCRTQIDILKQSGATAVRIMLDKRPWDTNDTSNILGLKYRDYVKQLVAWCKPELKVQLDLSKDSSQWTDDYGWAQKKAIIETPALRTAWINWGKAVISHCNPDAIGLMGEPGGDGQTTTFNYYYDNFVIPSLNAYRAVDPNIIVFVMPMPFHDLSGFVTRPINDDKAIYEYHFYYNPKITSASQVQLDMLDAYAKGDLVAAKGYLFDYFDWKFSGLPKDRINIGELGVLGMTGDDPSSILTNWRAFMQDCYDYVEQQQLQGLFQFGITKKYYCMLGPGTNYTELTPYGELWAQNCPV